MDIDLVELIKEIEETDKLLASSNYPQEKIGKHRVEFERWVNDRYISNVENVKDKTSFVMTKSEYFCLWQTKAYIHLHALKIVFIVKIFSSYRLF